MRRSTLPFRNLLWHWRTHLGVLLGSAIAATIMTGALGVGDSVRGSLGHVTDLRLGRITYTLDRGGRHFRHTLAESMADALDADASGILHLHGTAQRPDGSAYAGRIDVYGVDSAFAALAPRRGMSTAHEPASAPDAGASPSTTSMAHPQDKRGAFPTLAPGTGAVNQHLAERLRLQVGDTLVVRLPDPHRLPGDVLPDRAGRFRSRSVRVEAILDAEAFGDFRLRQEQRDDATLFVPLDDLQATLDLEGLCNLLLLPGTTRDGTPIPPDAANAALHAHLQPEDLELSLQRLPGTEEIEIRSRRIFLPPEIAAPLRTRFPDAVAVSTYLVADIATGSRRTPYSFVAAVEGGTFPQPEPGQMIPSDWLAGDLAPVPPDATVTLTLQRLNRHGFLVEESATLTLGEPFPLENLTAMHARTLMPAFPGFVDADSCRDWDPDLPVDLSRIRPEDEAYWETHGGTPRAFVHLRDAETMWGTPHGFLTALRIPWSGRDKDNLRHAIRESLAPLLPHLRPVREEAEHARRGGIDFGHLFLGLSMFLLLAAFLLSGTLHAFLIDERRVETGTYLALGFPPHRIRRLYLVEGSILAAAGSALGTPVGIAYTHGILHLLQTHWQGAVGTTHLWPHVRLESILAGFLASFACGTLTTALCIRNACREMPHAAQRATPSSTTGTASGRRAGWIGLLLTGTSIAAAILYRDTGDAVAVFFLAGTGLLVGLLLLLVRALHACRDIPPHSGMASLALRQASHRPSRSLAATAALACGVFVVVAVGANHRDPAYNADAHSSGTGGYALYGETALPLPRDGTNPLYLDATSSDEATSPHARVLPLRLVEGDDASCLNLHRVQRPALVGIDPAVFQNRSAFTFLRAAGGFSVQDGWNMLSAPLPDGAIPAVADADVIQWGLGLSVGDEIEYENDHGGTIRVRLVGAIRNSIFQGRLLVPEAVLLEQYPSTNAVRLFLVDTDTPGRTAASLREHLHDHGVFVQPTAARLAMFGEVERTYLSIFLLLGGLGVMLGSVGLGVLLLRGTLARRGEFAVMQAVGFSRRRLTCMLVAEHVPLLLAGMGVGAGASLMVLLPQITAAGSQLPWGWLAAILLALPVNGLLWITVAARLALSTNPLAALREE